MAGPVDTPGGEGSAPSFSVVRCRLPKDPHQSPIGIKACAVSPPRRPRVPLAASAAPENLRFPAVSTGRGRDSGPARDRSLAPASRSNPMLARGRGASVKTSLDVRIPFGSGVVANQVWWLASNPYAGSPPRTVPTRTPVASGRAPRPSSRGRRPGTACGPLP